MGLVRPLQDDLAASTCGKLEGEWELAIFPESDPDKRRRLIRWDRFLLVGHALIVVVSLYFGLWMVPVLVTLAPFYGGWLLFLCNNTQHIGLQDDVPDFRLCTRTVILNPFFRFLYWHMNYHIEHHMYAAVPCYRLGKLHAAIKSDLPHCPRGLYERGRKSPPSSNGKRPSQNTNTCQNCPRPSQLDCLARSTNPPP